MFGSPQKCPDYLGVGDVYLFCIGTEICLEKNILGFLVEEFQCSK